MVENATPMSPTTLTSRRTRKETPYVGLQRRRILDCAAALFAERSFDGTSINDITTAAQCPNAALYRCFTSKEDLLFAVVSEQVNALLRIVTGLRQTAADPEHQLSMFVSETLAIYAERRDFNKVLITELRCLPAVRRALITAKQRDLLRYVENLLVALRPSLRSTQLQGAAAMTLFGMMNWMHTWFRPDGHLKVADLGGLITDIVIGGLTMGHHARPPSSHTR